LAFGCNNLLCLANEGKNMSDKTTPAAWWRRAADGSILCWTSADEDSLRLAKEAGYELAPLYDQAALDAAVAAERERWRSLLAECAAQTRHPDYDWPMCLQREVAAAKIEAGEGALKAAGEMADGLRWELDATKRAREHTEAENARLRADLLKASAAFEREQTRADAAEMLAETALAAERERWNREPVAAQCRFPGVAWTQCDVEHARMVLAKPSEWSRYEVRLLCEWVGPNAQASRGG
jgi:hypothetical protein